MVHGCEFLKHTAPKMHWSLIINKAAFPSNSLYIIKHYNVLGKDPAINFFFSFLPANKYILKINNRTTTKKCEICSKLTIRTPGRN